MIVYRYIVNDYISCASGFAKMINVPWHGHYFEMPETLGKLHIEVYNYEDNFSVSFLSSFMNYESNLVRTGTDNEDLLTLDFYIPKDVKLSIEEGEEGFSKLKYGGYFGTSNYKSTIKIPAKENFFQFNIILSRTFLKRFFELSPNKSKTLQSLMNLDRFFIYQPPSRELINVLTNIMLSFDENHYRKQFAYAKALELATLFFDSLEQCPEIHLSDYEAALLYELQKEILHNPAKEFTIPYILAKTGLSHYRLKILLNELYGSSIGQFVKKLKMDKAMSFLSEGKTVSETGYLIGYSNLSHFSKAFKQTFGFLPSEYQKGNLSA
ncbi:MAG: helix-turn-helix domain-containing protein [Bacteroidales bacterium]